ncbi:MAG TPA: transporter [Brevundimonas sp.]|jgi:glutathione synthase/RimK-type ligase-like ATP-grasp enzyme|uniref:ATP-grasp domain-containing protein n=1 Tax=Brevundimonas sp. TaxID=1871086 RepID=UPI002DEEF0E6|nr:transporter [Brevundimonas sp.]
MFNPPGVLGWNSDKSYLGRLADRGVPIPPTIWTDAPTRSDVDSAFDRFGTDQVVVKPRVSGGAWKTLRLSRGQPLTGAPDGPSLIQPYLPSIVTDGETSLLFFGRRFSHAVRKTPVPGDFRIQVQFGGRYESVAPPPEALALAEAVLAGIDEDLLYARIDLARDADGGWLLMEAELIEPDLYLAQAPDGGAAFARAVRGRL